ncbi:MAG: NAD-dependent epimerase/dehydratase family protein [Candidatus Yanofskybacteria bacterium]|nr:NAD-dependent epimerase/dehydratase family protein [Candidatus Yanofskybacteria bacterium]
MPETKKPTALVTGAYGFVGPHMVRLLVDNGFKVIATDHPNAKPKLLPDGVECYPCDLANLLDTKHMMNKYKPDIGMFVASIFRYDIPRQTILKINATIMENCLKATRNHNPNVRHIVAWISASVYGDSFKNVTPGTSLTENAPMLPRIAYEESKFLQHLICQEYKDLPITEIFPMAIYGPGGNYGAMVVIDMMAKNQLPGFPGNGKNRISLVHVTDVCRAALFLAKRTDTIGKSYNLGGNFSYTTKELMKYLKKEFERLGVRIDLFPVSYPLWLMRFFAWRSEQIARKYNHPPLVQRDFLGYFEKGYDFLVSSKSIRDLRFDFIYDDPIKDGGLRETLEWMRKEKLI